MGFGLDNTNDARLVQILSLRGLQGLLYMCKGRTGLNPFFLDLIIMSRSTVAGLYIHCL